MDLTFYAAAILTIMLVASILRDEYRVAGHQILWSFAFLGLVLPGVLIAPVHSYAVEKSLYVATLTLLAFIAGLEAGHRPGGLTRMVGWLMVFSLLATSDALFQVVTNKGTLHRVSGVGGTTIGLGRAAGLVFLVEAGRFLLWPGSVMRQILSLAIAIPAAVVVLFSGSKGPLISAIIALLVILLLSGRKGVSLRLVLLGSLAALGLASVWSLTPTGSLGRLSTFFAGDYGDSETTRWLALQKALPLIATHPLGIGWGGFVGQVTQWAQDGRQYVHNLVVELFLEGGWITGFGFTLIFFRSWSLVRQRAHQHEALLWVGIILFTLFSALVSGDVNDNRLFFVLVGFGLGQQAPWGHPNSSVADLSEITNHQSRRGPCELSI